MLKQLHKSKLLRVLFSLSFFISGIFVNLIQFSLYITIRCYDKSLYRRINYYLIYTLWSQIVAISEWWSESKVRMFFADDDTLRSHAKQHTLYVMNHRYELDWLWSWMVLDKFGALGKAKSFAKKSLRFLPIIGWGWVLDEFVFLEREWKKDATYLPKALDQLMAYDPPMSLLLFCEGTRFTQSKYELGVEFSKQKGVAPLKYHLVPRTKGFAFCVRHIKQNFPDTTVIYDVQLAFSEDAKHLPTFGSIVRGKQLIGDYYLRKIDLKDVPTDTDEQVSDFLYELYQKKDQLMEYHERNGRFPGILVEKQRRIAPLINWMSWFVVVMISLSYLLFYVFTSGNLYLMITTTLVFVTALSSVYLMIGSTKIKKGSQYGTQTNSQTPKSESNPNNNIDDNSTQLRQRSNVNEING